MKMPKCKPSFVKEFIENALGLNLYPKTIYWIDKVARLACIHLKNQNNKLKAKESIEMLTAYAKLRTRKHQKDGGSYRQRFMQALKASPYIKICQHSEGEKEKTFIYLKGKGENSPAGSASSTETSADLSLMDQSDAHVVPQMIENPVVEDPCASTFHESDTLEFSSPSRDATVAQPNTPQSYFQYENMNLRSLASDSLESEPPTDPGTDGPDDLSSERTPDFSDVVELEDEEMTLLDSDYFPSDYDPREELLQGYYLRRGSYINNYEVGETSMINFNENGIIETGLYDPNEVNRPDAMVMFSLNAHQDTSLQPNQKLQS